MNTRRSFRTLTAVSVASLAFLTACGTSPPPTDEFVNEVIDSLAQSDRFPDGLSTEVIDCMHEAADTFALTDDEVIAFEDLGQAAEDTRADDADKAARAQAVVDRFTDELAACR